LSDFCDVGRVLAARIAFRSIAATADGYPSEPAARPAV